MTEQDFNKQLQEINNSLKKIEKNTGTPLWRSFLSGTLSGLGGIFGVALALVIIGWILNLVGVIPAFRSQVTVIEQDLNNLHSTK